MGNIDDEIRGILDAASSGKQFVIVYGTVAEGITEMVGPFNHFNEASEHIDAMYQTKGRGQLVPLSKPDELV
jgi:hypothetical protein